MKSRLLRFNALVPHLSLAALALVSGCGSDGDSAGGTGGTSASGGSVSSSGGAATTSGGVAATSGGVAATSGGMAATSGGVAATSGGAATSSGGVAATSGGVAATSGGVAATSGGVAATSGGASAGAGMGGSAGGASSGTFSVSSPGWVSMAGCAANAAASCATLPKELTRTGGGVGMSPELNWTGVPAGTKSFAVVLQDLTGNNTHWMLWNIPGTATTLAANVDQSSATPAVPAGSQQCSKNPTAGAEGYYGPGACGNVYEFTLYALSVATFSPTTPTNEIQVRTQLLALGSSILGTASTRGRTFAPNCP
ncbi:MAG: hypothetical protein QM756_08065 [Polyangiaceae bacterium]